MSFKTNKSPQSQTDMIALGKSQPELGAFNARELFETAIHWDRLRQRLQHGFSSTVSQPGTPVSGAMPDITRNSGR